MFKASRSASVWVVVGLVLAIPQSCWSAAPAKTPPFKDVEEIVRRQFATLPDRGPQDIIVRSEVETAFKQIEKKGWRIPYRAQLLAKVHGDQDFLPQVLRTEAGTEFMRQIAGYPLGYDRLDHLSIMPQGEQNISAMIRGPGGYKMIEYMTSERGGLELGRMMNNCVNGAGFNDPTGRIYTVDGLLSELKRAYTVSAGKPPAQQQ